MSSSSSGPIRRTTHACVQCRERKQKCGGVTSQGRCTSCQTRETHCSFIDEASDPRYNPYLRIQSNAPRSPTAETDGQEGRNTPARSRQSRTPSVRRRSPAARDVTDNEIVGRLQAEMQMMRDELHRMREVTQAPPAPIQPEVQSYDFDNYENPFPDPQPSTVTSNALDMDLQGVNHSHNLPLETLPSQHPTYNQPSSARHSINSAPSFEPQPMSAVSTSFEGPMRVLHNLGADDGSDMEENDPIKRSAITLGEAVKSFQIFFEHCHLNAPFLDAAYDSDMEDVRKRSPALFLNIVAIGFRFWSHSSRRDVWLNSRYPKLIRLLDTEMTRLILSPRPRDNQLETVQAWMLYSHWMPVDVSDPGHSCKSRFSESSAWQCLGSAIRWATLLGFDRTAAVPFLSNGNIPTPEEVREYRTMLYLTESDFYLALSTRKSPTLPVDGLYAALPRFLSDSRVQPTDHRLSALFKVVQSIQVMGGKADSIETLEAFNYDVNQVDKEYKALTLAAGLEYDKMSQHFPFTSLRWYRLSFASTILPAPSQWHEGHPGLRMSIEWASQILYHLSASASETPFQTDKAAQQALDPDPHLVGLLSFAIDQYFMVIAYTASFLVLAWKDGAMDNQLQLLCDMKATSNIPARSSTLYRLVDLASRTLTQCAPSRGHLAIRYAEFLRGLADGIAAGPSHLEPPQPAHQGGLVQGFQPLQNDFDLGNNVSLPWDGNWLTLLQNAGVSDWVFGHP